MTLQIVTILFLFIIVVLSVIVGSRAHQKEREETERRFTQLKLMNRADRTYSHISSIAQINTDSIVTDVLYDFYIDTLRDLVNYTDDIDAIEQKIAKAEEERNLDLAVYNTSPSLLSFQEKANYKERLTKLAKLLLFMRRKGRISHSHYQACYDYLRWLNLDIQVNRQLVQANTNFTTGDTRVARTLYGVILSHVRADPIQRPEKKMLETYVDEKIKEIYEPTLRAIENADTPEEAEALVKELSKPVDISGLDSE
ncbi:DNA topoisomerase I [Marinomonas sp. 42_23_T18]|nr:DNA topoisomerase I [Marinomonas sp. 42_23_T18]